MEELDDATFEFGVVTLPVDGVTGAELTAATADMAPKSATYITQTSNATLTNEIALSTLGGPGILSFEADGTLLKATGSDLPSHNHTFNYDRQFFVDGGGATITTGVKGVFRVPWASTITEWNLFADQSGSIQIDLWRENYTDYGSLTDADSITGSAPLTLSGTSFNAVATGGLTGWDTTLDAGDIIKVNVDSATTVQWVLIVLLLTRTI